MAQHISNQLQHWVPLSGEKKSQGSQPSNWRDCWVGSCPYSAGHLWAMYTLCCSPGSTNWYKVLSSSFKTYLGYRGALFTFNQFYSIPREPSRQNRTTHRHILLGRTGIMTAFTLPPRDPGSFSSSRACWHPSERYYTFLQEGFEPFFLNLFWGILQFLFLFSLADGPHFPSWYAQCLQLLWAVLLCVATSLPAPPLDFSYSDHLPLPGGQASLVEWLPYLVSTPWFCSAF